MTGPRVACPVGCGQHVNEGHLLCRACWLRVPPPVQRDVWWTFRRWRRTGLAADLERYWAARETAIKAATPEGAEGQP